MVFEVVEVVVCIVFVLEVESVEVDFDGIVLIMVIGDNLIWYVEMEGGILLVSGNIYIIDLFMEDVIFYVEVM